MNSIINTAADDPFGNQLIEDMRWLGRLAARLVADPGLADDACQEAWMSASGGGEQPPSREQLATGVRRFLLMHWRGSARRRAREHVSAREDRAPAVDQLLTRRESQVRIWDELVELGEPHRQTLLMRFQEGLSTRQIASALDATQDTVRRHVREGVAILRRKLEADHEGGGLAAIAAAVPASLRGGEVAAETGGRAGFGAMSVKVGAAILALGVCALVVHSALASPVAPVVEPMATEERAAGPSDLSMASLHPEPGEGRLALVPPSTLAEPLSTEPIRAAAVEAQQDGSKVRGTGPDKVHVTLRTLDGFDLPERVSVMLELQCDEFIGMDEASGEVEVVDGAFDIAFEWDSDLVDMIAHGQVTVTANGFGAQTGTSFAMGFYSPKAHSAEVFLYPSASIPIRVAHAGTGKPIRDARLAMQGASGSLGYTMRTDAGGRALLLLMAPEAAHLDLEKDELFVQSKGTGIGHWSRLELERLPLQHDGTRLLELVPSSTVRGKVVMESGDPVPPGTMVAYSMDRSREATAFDFPSRMAPVGRAAIEEDGRFTIEGLTKGLLVLQPQTSRQQGSSALGPDLLLEIPMADKPEVSLHVPAESNVLTLHLAWTGPDEVISVRLYGIDATDSPYSASLTPRKLLATRDHFSVLEDVPIQLPKGSLDEGRPYLLEIRPTYDTYLERLIVFHGVAPRLEHSFADVAALECPSRIGATPEEYLQSKSAEEQARKAGALTVLHARTE